MPDPSGWALVEAPNDEGATWHAVKLAQDLKIGTVAIHTVCGQVIQGYEVPSALQPPSSEPVCEFCRSELGGPSEDNEGTA